jgi:hypothetical protein
MRYTLTWLPEENLFAVACETGDVAYLHAHVFRKLVRYSRCLRGWLDDATRQPDEPILLTVGIPPECRNTEPRTLATAREVREGRC